MSRPRRTPVVLLVEDDEADVLMMRRSLQCDELPLELLVAEDGEQALALLKLAEVPDGKRPDLVLLDLNLPRLNGKEVLAAIRADERLAGLPVVVVSTSDAPRDVADCYRLGANAVVTKPTDFKRFREVVGVLRTFWLTMAHLPGHAQAAPDAGG